MDTHKVVRYWLESADKDWEVARNLFKFKHYAYCLFFSHLTREAEAQNFVIKWTFSSPSFSPRPF